MWGRIGIGWCLLLLLHVGEAKDETRLRVSIRKEPLQTVSSCIHAFSQVELLNLDETEPIVIHSVDLAEEESFDAKTLEVKDTVPQQIHISSLSEVTLGPKQNAIIPMTFVPRFPEQPLASSSEPAVETRSEARRRNNLDYEESTQEFQVKTSIVLDTSRGMINIPIEASSIRQNGYRLPDVIHFRPQEEPTDSPTIQGDGNLSDDCFDVYMSNPFPEKGLQIFDVVVSRPDLVKMFDHDKEMSDTAVTEMFKNWQGGEQRSIAPGVNDEYVITLCPQVSGESIPEETLKRKGGLPPTSDMNDGLGYLQIRTNSNVLVVNLQERKNVDVVPVKEKDEPVAETPNVAGETPNVPAQCDSNEGRLDTLTSREQVVPPPKNLSLSVTEAPHIEIELVPFVSPSFIKTIELRNTSPYPIKVMKAAMKLDYMADPVLVEEAKRVGLTVDAKIGKRNTDVVSSDPLLIDETVVLTCAVSSSSSHLDPEEPLRFTGSIHVAASSDVNSSYAEWVETIKSNPQKDSKLGMIFPFAINVVDRQVHIVLNSSSTSVPPTWKHETPLSGAVKSLTGLFYPIARTWGNTGETSNKSSAEPIPDEIVYTIGVVSPVGRPISVGKMEVVDSARRTLLAKSTSLCLRFTITGFNVYPSPPRIENSSLFNLGKATLKYNFDKVAEPKIKKIRSGGKSGIGLDDGPVLPQTCYLQVLTDQSDGGRLSIPLVLFTGRLDATAHEYDTPLREHEKPNKQNSVAPSIVTGFDDILNWLRSFGMGSAVKKVLKTIFDSRMGDGPTMLAGYMADLSSVSLLSEGHSIRPILLNVGSVVHDEVQSFPLYLANHNPVPVDVSIDVGEVEGMSISVAREFSHGNRDGNGLLDRLPKEETIKSAKVKSGRWKGHTRRGLQRFLVKSSEFPQAISSSLQYRDDISLSSAAAEIQPMLRTLYDEKDVGYFHADSVPRDLHFSEVSSCPGLDLNPPAYSDDAPSINGSYPLIMSDNLSFSRRLGVCRETPVATTGSGSKDESRSPLSIPPGGLARFEVKVRCPSRRVLNSDITNFLGTGLVLSTNYGQAIPILVSFEALLGNLQISSLASSELNVTPSKGSYTETIIDLPPGLFLTRTKIGELPGNATLASAKEINEIRGNSSLPLYIASSFAREVSLKKVESCNPWFDVRLSNHGLKNETPTVVAGEKVEIGWMKSAIPCHPFQYNGGSDDFRLDLPGEIPQVPSFYECALEWLQNRYKIQPRGCGLSTEGSSTGEHKLDEVLEIASKALRKAVHYSLIRFDGGVPRRLKRSSSTSDGSEAEEALEPTSGGSESDVAAERAVDLQKDAVRFGRGSTTEASPYIPRVVVDLFAQVSNAWRLVTESGLNIVSTNLKAQIEYSLSEDGEKSNATQTLSVAMREVAVRTPLQMPTLVDRTQSHEIPTTEIDGSEVAVLQFPPTRIADVNSLTVPLYNPTSVPVRVRLAAFTKSPQSAGVGDYYSDVDFGVVPSGVRTRYLQKYSPVYVQNVNIRDQPSRSDAQHWWEGGGVFVLTDDRGDMIQSHFNLSITAGPRAHVSLINPSSSGFNGLTAGCGTRCGVKDDAHANIDPSRQYCPIGASSASGFTLMGRPRPQIVPLAPGDRNIATGGSTPASPSLLAFAIPYSSLDEIVLPPYGTGELGPILFRPPGRHSILGCGTAAESLGNATIANECETKGFESLFFLENSLTGLERIVVRGEGMLESVAFLDPPLSSDTPFGDLEHRYGRSTLVFPGSAEAKASKSRLKPVRKEVVVQNDGDAPVEFGRLYFSQSPDLRLNSPSMPRSIRGKSRRALEKRRVDDGGSSMCERRGFQLVGCSERGGREIEVSGKRTANLAHGFALAPGQNISLFVDHYPDCAFTAEYVTLNLEYREEKRSQASWLTGPSRSRHRTAPRDNKKSKPRNLELLVGFEMDAGSMASCVPIRSAAKRDMGKSHGPHLTASSGTNATEAKWESAQDKRHGFSRWLMFPAIRLAMVSSATIAAVWVMKQSVVRDAACSFFRVNLRGGGGGSVNGSSTPDISQASSETDWSAAFRCLARVDPVSSELQAVGREQARQLVLDRYKSVGAMTPHCISSAGVFMRDRSGVVGAGGRVVSGNEKRAMTFSDAVFRGAFTDQGADSDLDQLLPCSLGWRAASSKGLVRKSSRASKSKEVLARREAAMSVIHENGPPRDADETSDGPVSEESLVVEEEEIDEQKGDVVSTSESEGSASVAKEEIVDVPVIVEEEDFAGFAKVSSQKGKKESRNKNKNKASEAPKSYSKPQVARGRKDGTLDTPQVLVYKKEPKAQNYVTPQAQEHTRYTTPQDAKIAASSNVRAQQQTRVASSPKPAPKKVSAFAPPKGKKTTKSKQPAAPIPPAPIDGRIIGVVNSPIGMRSMSSVGSASPVSVSSRSTSRSSASRSEMKNTARAPPGLAPPPGFATGGLGDVVEQSIQHHAAADPPMVPNLYPADPPSLSLASSGYAAAPPVSGTAVKRKTKTSNNTLAYKSEQRPVAATVSPVLSSQIPLVRSETQESQFSDSGFDVMDFLDNILGDQEPKEEETIGDLLAEKRKASMPVSSDPWATERRSRAAAYGIHVEDDGKDDEEEIVYAMLAAPMPTNRTNGGSRSSGLHNSVPLLTPAAILNQNELNEGDEHRSSFYSSLLRE